LVLIIVCHSVLVKEGLAMGVCLQDLQVRGKKEEEEEEEEEEFYLRLETRERGEEDDEGMVIGKTFKWNGNSGGGQSV
jgi:hypothetical protein